MDPDFRRDDGWRGSEIGVAPSLWQRKERNGFPARRFYHPCRRSRIVARKPFETKANIEMDRGSKRLLYAFYPVFTLYI